jgi:putative FmdB family regulatory protein
MPIYEYRCENCDETFEELIYRQADEDEVVCPSCGGRQVERNLSAPALTGPGGGAARPHACGPIG